MVSLFNLSTESVLFSGKSYVVFLFFLLGIIFSLLSLSSLKPALFDP